jgi:hypothetical protein
MDEMALGQDFSKYRSSTIFILMTYCCHQNDAGLQKSSAPLHIAGTLGRPAERFTFRY